MYVVVKPFYFSKFHIAFVCACIYLAFGLQYAIKSLSLAAAVSVGTYSAWESTATLRLLGGARGAWAPTGEERGGAYCVATRTACYLYVFDALRVVLCR